MFKDRSVGPPLPTWRAGICRCVPLVIINSVTEHRINRPKYYVTTKWHTSSLSPLIQSSQSPMVTRWLFSLILITGLNCGPSLGRQQHVFTAEPTSPQNHGVVRRFKIEIESAPQQVLIAAQVCTFISSRWTFN